MTDISLYLNRIDILHETTHQIIKDFAMQGIEIKISENPGNSYSELFSKLLPYVETLFKENVRNFYTLIYRIDISEIQIKKAVERAKDQSFSEVVTDLILKRELLKVVIRKSYKAGKEL